jgi:hypothetical protein
LVVDDLGDVVIIDMAHSQVAFCLQGDFVSCEDYRTVEFAGLMFVNLQLASILQDGVHPTDVGWQMIRDNQRKWLLDTNYGALLILGVVMLSDEVRIIHVTGSIWGLGKCSVWSKIWSCIPIPHELKGLGGDLDKIERPYLGITHPLEVGCLLA